MKKQQDIQMEIPEKKPVIIGGIRQNCYALDVRTDISALRFPTNRTIKKYYSLEKETLPNGYTESVQEKDYPINSDSVTSYVESSDYRNDPNQAIANAPKRVNLGDITEVQSFVKENPVQATLQYADILNKVASYMKQQANAGHAVVSPTSAVEDKEVKI